jgi:hypothetical protein
MGGLSRIVIAMSLLACSHPATTGPAWPKQAKVDKDGGESLAPHESKQTAVALEKEDDAPAPVTTPKPAAAVPAPAVDVGTAAAATPAMSSTVEDAITTEDIIIEIDD